MHRPAWLRSLRPEISARPSRRRRPVRPIAAEVLEVRLLLAGQSYDGEKDFGVAGRASDGKWYASGFNAGVAGLENQQFAQWNAAVDWRDVRFGDYDGDTLSDVAGRDPVTGNWYVTLSDGVGSTTVLAGKWSNAVDWVDVAAVNLAALGDRPDDNHGKFGFTSDLVGRDAATGNWWAAVSNGDGTFNNVFLVNWAPGAGWKDVRFFDLNNDKATDIVGRDSTGKWWAAVSAVDPVTEEGLTYTTKFLAQWNENAGWKDVLVAKDFLTPTMPELIARTSTGQWYGLDFSGANGATVTTKALGGWAEAAGWKDVTVGHLMDSNLEKLYVLGRTSNGEWWKSEIGAGGVFQTEKIGQWNEAAGWKDVQVVKSTHSGFFQVLVGRTSNGEWWSSHVPVGGTQLATTKLGQWNEAAGWKNVRGADVNRSPVVTQRNYLDSGETIVRVFIHAHRSGISAAIQNYSTIFTVGVTVTLSVDSTGYVLQKNVTVLKTDDYDFVIDLNGHCGDDLFTNASSVNAVGDGRLGDDLFHGQGNNVADTFNGGPGADTLVGDPEDNLSTGETG